MDRFRVRRSPPSAAAKDIESAAAGGSQAETSLTGVGTLVALTSSALTEPNPAEHDPAEDEPNPTEQEATP